MWFSNLQPDMPDMVKFINTAPMLSQIVEELESANVDHLLNQSFQELGKLGGYMHASSLSSLQLIHKITLKK